MDIVGGDRTVGVLPFTFSLVFIFDGAAAGVRAGGGLAVAFCVCC